MIGTVPYPGDTAGNPNMTLDQKLVELQEKAREQALLIKQEEEAYTAHHHDIELDAMSLCAHAFNKLDDTQRWRILAWLNARYGKRAE